MEIDSPLDSTCILQSQNENINSIESPVYLIEGCEF